MQGIHEAGTGEFVKQCEISLNNLKNSLDSCRSLAIINIYFYIFLNGSYAGDENVLKANTSGKQQDVTITNDQCVEKSYRVR